MNFCGVVRTNPRRPSELNTNDSLLLESDHNTYIQTNYHELIKNNKNSIFENNCRYIFTQDWYSFIIFQIHLFKFEKWEIKSNFNWWLRRKYNCFQIIDLKLKTWICIHKFTLNAWYYKLFSNFKTTYRYLMITWKFPKTFRKL